MRLIFQTWNFLNRNCAALVKEICCGIEVKEEMSNTCNLNITSLMWREVRRPVPDVPLQSVSVTPTARPLSLRVN